MEKNIKAKQERGAFLWIMVAVYIVISFQRLMGLLFPTLFLTSSVGAPAWGYNFNFLAFILELIGIIGIIAWKKWGIYVVITIGLVGSFLATLYPSSRAPIGVIWVVDLSIMGLLIWAVKRRWSHFR
jgi:hypothetical protein